MRSTFLSRVSGFLTILVFFLAFSFSSVAQEETKPKKDKTHTQDKMTGDENKFEQTANSLTQTLSQKINLTEDQRTEINDALISYQKDLSSLDPQMEDADRTSKMTELNNSIKTDIEGVLDDNQMTAYQEFSEQWWRDVNTQIHTATVRDNVDTDEQY